MLAPPLESRSETSAGWRLSTSLTPRWRYLPVINRMLHWYMLLHARMTENPPILTFQAAGGDRIDAELAEVMDAVWKHIWFESAAGERLDDLFAWLIPAGESFMKSRIDLSRREAVSRHEREVLHALSDSTSAVMRKVRALSHQLRPLHLDHLGLAACVKSLVKEVAQALAAMGHK